MTRGLSRVEACVDWAEANVVLGEGRIDPAGARDVSRCARVDRGHGRHAGADGFVARAATEVALGADRW